jgi:hypothetical protein
MKFAYSGPFSNLHDPIRSVKPARDSSGRVIEPQPRYTPTSPERYSIQSALPRSTVDYLIHLFGREHAHLTRAARRRTRKPQA